MKKILVTGATGFLGRHVIEALLASAPASPETGSIRILSRSGNPWPQNLSLECVHGDVTDPETLGEAVRGVDVVVHLAGLVSRDVGAAQAMYDINVGGTHNICEAALESGVGRLVVASTSGTIAVSRAPALHTETSPYATQVTANWPYYVSKIKQEQVAMSYQGRAGLDVVVLNPSILLGPGDIHRSSTNDIRAFLDRRIPSVPSGGFSFVDARDAALAFVSAIERGRGGQRYLIGGENVTVREFFQLLERISGIRAPKLALPEWMARAGAACGRAAMRLVGSQYPVDDISIRMAYRFWYCDNTLAVRELNLRPRPSEETIRDTVDFIRNEARAGGTGAL